MAQNSLGFSPAIKAGFDDMLNPGGITGLFFFIVFLLFLVVDRRFFWRHTVYFVLGNLIGRIFSLLGFFDKAMFSLLPVMFIKSFYFLFSIFCIGFGAWLLGEWFLSFFYFLKRPNYIKSKIIKFSQTPVVDRRPWFKIVFSIPGLLAGLILAFFQSLWGNDDYLYYVFLQLFVPATEPAWFFLFPSYLSILQIPFFLFAGLSWAYLKDERGCAKLHRVADRIQLIWAAFFIGYGVSFLRAYGSTLLNFFKI